MKKTRYAIKANGMLDGREVKDYLDKRNLLDDVQYSIPGIAGLFYSRYYITKPVSYIRGLWIAFVVGVKTAKYPGEIQILKEN